MHGSTSAAGMDIHPYLERWQHIEPHRCSHDRGDFWVFHSNQHEGGTRCDVVSFHGVGIVEDIIGECILGRAGWSHELLFDRNEETFSASVSTEEGRLYEGVSSLNPGIALLSAYLAALEAHRQPLSPS